VNRDDMAVYTARVRLAYAYRARGNMWATILLRNFNWRCWLVA
jgi:hypothetical protein